MKLYSPQKWLWWTALPVEGGINLVSLIPFYSNTFHKRWRTDETWIWAPYITGNFYNCQNSHPHTFASFHATSEDDVVYHFSGRTSDWSSSFCSDGTLTDFIPSGFTCFLTSAFTNTADTASKFRFHFGSTWHVEIGAVRTTRQNQEPIQFLSQ